MMTKRISIAFFFFAMLAVAFSLKAQNVISAFGIGLIRTDTSEIITYIARESALNDVGAQIGDEIVEVDGVPLLGRDLVASVAAQNPDTLRMTLMRKGDSTAKWVSIPRTHLRHQKQERLAMIDHTTATLKVANLTEDSIDMIEAKLDSLVTGESGFGKCMDTMLARQDEARIATLRAYGHIPRHSSFDLDNEVDAFRGDMMNYITDKYGWSMQKLLLDFSGKSAVPSEVMRAIRSFCKERKIVMIRQI